MSIYRISYRYANSFFQLAEEKKLLKKYGEDIELIFNTLSQSKELRSVLRNPVIKQKDKKNLLSKIFGSKIRKETSEFLDFIVGKSREDIMMEIMKEFLNLRDDKEGIVRTGITSSVDLTDSVKKDLVSKLEKRTGKKVKPEYYVDKNLIGGFIVNINDTMLDASVKHQLDLLRKKFSEEISI
ncbi:MAG TPA: ATP synthase F1 subunit delta [Melioribacteraceae bacterium]|nr:ATP synthase F1 subunit delta [Melioribacteraceae bacterium]